MHSVGLLLQSLKVSEPSPPTDQSMDSDQPSQCEPTMSPSSSGKNNDTNKGSASENNRASSSQGSKNATTAAPSIQEAHNVSAGGNDGDGEEPHEHRSVNLKRRYCL